MTLTLEHFLDLIDELPKYHEYDYVKGGVYKIRLEEVDHNNKNVAVTKVDTSNSSVKTANITTENLSTFVKKVVENKPLHIESVWNGSGSSRSAWEGLFAHTSEFYTYFSGNKKYLVWVPSHPHTPGKMETLTEKMMEELSLNHPAVFECVSSKYRPYITAIKSKPFLLLAGISGTGKSRIVRELARACWNEDSEEFKSQKPENFEMVQVKPNWHDSSELIGYVSRIDGEKFVVGPFLRFLVKAIQHPDMPYFFCLDEMNLAPVEQYFAEYLSVMESRKKNEQGEIVIDPIVNFEVTTAYKSLIDQLFVNDEAARRDYLTESSGKRLSLPANLIIVGTVNMDETTFSFSRKVLDRAMTIEMNEVDLDAGLTERYEHIGKLGCDELIGTAVEGVDVYAANKEVCDKVLTYLKAVNAVLEGTSFKIAYRTRNEFLLYVVNNLSYRKDEAGNELTEEYVIARALDEVTSMKILSRIEGDDTKVKDSLLDDLIKTIRERLKDLSEEFVEEKSVSLAKLKEMKKKLDSGFTSFWSY
ncbi:hypothetical protein DW204_07135 [Phocaeicola plebeius]|uniref:ATPase dynein-related AAA domain-containing protein n=1 Tax=Phocaeicola plebeius TaxID=310297 RepID=A0A414X0V0_9BACT|nr:AAA family ATPase [Phocaeicola plebeius]RHH45781.1 hypothetical protein DW204_07135 [Phocaeicola plebeius]